jgi:hypothetical protein
MLLPLKSSDQTNFQRDCGALPLLIEESCRTALARELEERANAAIKKRVICRMEFLLIIVYLLCFIQFF